MVRIHAGQPLAKARVPGDGGYRTGRISESCMPVSRGASGFGVPPLGGAFWAASSLASRLKAELQTRFLEAQPVFATFGDAPYRTAKPNSGVTSGPTRGMFPPDS